MTAEPADPGPGIVPVLRPAGAVESGGLPPADAAAYALFAREVRSLLGLDLDLYRPAQVWRRAGGFARSRGYIDARALVRACRTDARLLEAFRDMLTINVSEFFRNPDAFDVLGSKILPPMLAAGAVRIWSAGCSSGYEPYSIAIVALELSPSARVRILATDIDETVLARGRAGRYTTAQMAGVSEVRRATFFEPDGEGWRVRPEVRSLVTWRRHDLLGDPFPLGYDLIACRNVVIYFTEPAKVALYSRFRASLRPTGRLFVGATEAIPAAASIGLSPISPGFYRRADDDGLARRGQDERA